MYTSLISYWSHLGLCWARGNADCRYATFTHIYSNLLPRGLKNTRAWAAIIKQLHFKTNISQSLSLCVLHRDEWLCHSETSTETWALASISYKSHLEPDPPWQEDWCKITELFSKKYWRQIAHFDVGQMERAMCLCCARPMPTESLTYPHPLIRAFRSFFMNHCSYIHFFS